MMGFETKVRLVALTSSLSTKGPYDELVRVDLVSFGVEQLSLRQRYVRVFMPLRRFGVNS